MDGKDDTTTESVVPATRLALDAQTRTCKELLLVACRECRLSHLVALGGAVAQTKAGNGGIGKPTLAKVTLAHTQTLIGIAELLFEIVVGPTVNDHHTLAVVVALLLLVGHLALLNLDTILLGHEFQCLDIGHLLVLHNEGDGIATLSATETLIQALGGRHDKRRGILGMKRTTRLIVHTRTFECDKVADDIDDIGGGINSIYCCPINHNHKGNYFFLSITTTMRSQRKILIFVIYNEK